MFPVTNSLGLPYLTVCLWVLIIVIWSVVVSALVCATASASARLSRPPSCDSRCERSRGEARADPDRTRPDRRGPGARRFRRCSRHPVDHARGDSGFLNPKLIARDNRAAETIERIVPCGPVAIEFGPPSYDFFVMSGSAQGVAYQLQADGWQPGLTAFPASAASGLAIPKHAHWPRVLVTLRGRQGFVVTKIR